MPIFEYICEECRKEFEDLVRNESEANALVCPICHSKKIKKLISAAGCLTGSTNPVSPSSSSVCSTCTLKDCSTCK